MITTQSITWRAAFVGRKILDCLSLPQMASVGAADGKLLMAYRHCMGDAWDDKLNLYGLRRVLAELGVEKPPMAKELVETFLSMEPTGALPAKEEIDAAYVSFVDASVPADDALFAIVLVLRDAVQRTYEQAILLTAEAAIREHKSTLRRKRTQLLLQDDYGSFDDHKWREEIAYFVERVILPRLAKK